MDINYIKEEVLKSAESVAEFFRHYCQTDMKLSENILSKQEYQKALDGKRHFRDAGGARS
jgi:hypothetical protein